MQTIGSTLTQDHHRCDDLFATAENAAGDGHWTDCADTFAAFRAAIEHHFRMEEQILFPAFEQRTGMTSGPTMIMRGEHEQMREVLERMSDAVARLDRDAYLGHSETLLILMQQHNVKEEGVLYPMSDQALAETRGALLQQMAALG